MVLSLGALGIVLGTAAAVAGAWFPARKAQLERWGGALFVGGLVLAGFGLPLI